MTIISTLKGVYEDLNALAVELDTFINLLEDSNTAPYDIQQAEKRINDRRAHVQIAEDIMSVIFGDTARDEYLRQIRNVGHKIDKTSDKGGIKHESKIDSGRNRKRVLLKVRKP